MQDLDLAIDRIELSDDWALLSDSRPSPHLDCEQAQRSTPHQRADVPHGLPPEGQALVGPPPARHYRPHGQGKYNLWQHIIMMPLSVLTLQQGFQFPGPDVFLETL